MCFQWVGVPLFISSNAGGTLFILLRTEGPPLLSYTWGLFPFIFPRAGILLFIPWKADDPHPLSSQRLVVLMGLILYLPIGWQSLCSVFVKLVILPLSPPEGWWTAILSFQRLTIPLTCPLEGRQFLPLFSQELTVLSLSPLECTRW